VALGGVCGLFRLDGGAVGDREVHAVERLAAAHGWRAEGGVAVSAEGAAVVAAFAPASGGPPGGPSVVEAGPVRVVADARLIARRGTAISLGALGEDPEPPDGAALVLRAYERWGDECPGRLLGDFAFVLWDGARERLLAARDPIGARPLHYRRCGDLLWLASEGRPLALAVEPEERRLDGYFLLDVLCFNLRDQARSPYAGVRRVLPGHRLAAGAGAGSEARSRRYWMPERDRARWLEEGLESEDDWSGAFRDLLEEVVRDHLADAPGGAAMLTSGGLDSSTLAVLAARAHRQGTIPGRPVAFVDVFERLRESDESEHGRTAVNHERMEAEWIVADDLSDLCLDETVGGLGDSPYSMPSELTAHTLRLARRRGLDLLTTGFGGDSLFDAARWQTFDLVRSGRLHRVVPWIAGAVSRGASWPRAAAAFLLPPLLSYRGRRRLDRLRGRSTYWHTPPWLTRAAGKAAAKRLADQGYDRRFRSFARQRQWEHAVGLAQHGAALESWTTHAARFGLETAFPLLDRRLVALALAAPLRFEARPGPAGTKWLLREATRGILPETIRRRAGKATWASHVRDTLCRRIPDAFAARFAGDSLLARHGLVDDRSVRETHAAFCGGPGSTERAPAGARLVAVWMAERWLAGLEPSPSGLSFEDLEPWEYDR
jgi:asparagine synthase (glutamine-hydrolysing)